MDGAVKFAQESFQVATDEYRGGLTNYLQVITALTSVLQKALAAVDISNPA